MQLPINVHPLQPSSQNNRDHFRISFAPLSLEDVYRWVDDPANGAIALMSGTVRGETEGRKVNYLEYQAYEPMAIQVFHHIGQQIRHQWPAVNRIAIHHRTGKLQIGEISVLVAVGSPHRAEAFAAARYAIDTLKHQAPIWKKEHWADGASSWVSIAACEAENKIMPHNQV